MATATSTAGSLTQRRPRRWRQQFQVALLRLVIVGGFLALWEFVAGRWIPLFIISKPSLVWDSLVNLIQSGKLWDHTQATISEILIGYPIGSVGGIALGYFMGRSRTMAGVFEPIIMGLYGVPRTALAPLFIIWLGIGIWSKVGIVVLMTFFLTFFNTYAGMRNMDQEFVNLARLMGAKGRTITFRVILPSIFPYVFVGLKTAVPQAVIGAVVGEFIVSTKGLGFYIRQTAALFDPAGLWVGVLVLMIAVLLANAGLDGLEKRLMRWKPAGDALSGG